MLFLSFKSSIIEIPSFVCKYCFKSFIFVFSQGNSNVSAIEVEREAAKKHMKERRLKAKRKRELKQQEELALAVSEKEAIEDELEELKIAAASTNSDERLHELFEKKLLKMKKKYEKKIAVTRMDLLDATEVFIILIIDMDRWVASFLSDSCLLSLFISFFTSAILFCSYTIVYLYLFLLLDSLLRSQLSS